MIFVTVGTQGSFDRLIRAVDVWAGKSGRGDIFAQTGKTSFRPEHVEYVATLDATEFKDKLTAASVVVAHAGMGTILGALELGMPIIVMPRRHAFGEHRNDHQLDTAERLREMGWVKVAQNEQELGVLLDDVDQMSQTHRIDSSASPELLRVIGDFIDGPSAPAESSR